MTTREFLDHVDNAVANANNLHGKHCCVRGCHHCCSEELHVDEREADLIIDSIHPKHMAQVEAQTAEWLSKAAPLLDTEDTHDASEWRAVDKPCPLLINGLCSVYAVRPFACRIFFAIGNPDNCRMPERTEQKFANFAVEKTAALMAPFIEDQKTVVLDHLGVFLAEKLLGLDLRGRTRTIYELLQNQNEEQNQEARAVESAP